MSHERGSTGLLGSSSGAMPKSKELVSSSSSGSDSDSEVDKKVTIPGPSRFCIPSSAELFIARSKGQ